jgi:RimJ/RimL family protein N-acetyltransferase
MFRPDHPLETTRLTLRPFAPGDFDDLYAYQSRPDVARYLATEAAEALLTLGFDTIGWHRIIGSCDARNDPSARLMERIGMRQEARFVHNQIVKGLWADEFVYAILDHEWRARKPASRPQRPR